MLDVRECCGRPVWDYVHDECLTCHRTSRQTGLGTARRHIHVANPYRPGDTVWTSECSRCIAAGEQLTLTL